MIEVTRFDGSKTILNALLIERIEHTPDTVITLTTGKQFVTRETSEELMALIVAYLRAIRTDDSREPSLAQIARATD